MRTTDKVSVSLTPEMLHELRAAVAAGDYVSTGEALLDAIRSWQRQRAEDAAALAALRARVQRSLAAPRPSLSEADVIARLNALLDGNGV